MDAQSHCQMHLQKRDPSRNSSKFSFLYFFLTISATEASGRASIHDGVSFVYLILIVPGKVTKCTVLHAIRGVYFSLN